MKKMILMTVLALTSVISFCQPNKPRFIAAMGIGYSSASHPLAELAVGYHHGPSYIFYDQKVHLSNLSKLPMMFSMNYGYNIHSWQPYGGLAYHAGYQPGWKPSYGLIKYYNHVSINAGMSGKYFTGSIGVTSSNIFYNQHKKVKNPAPVVIASISLISGMSRGLHETLINHYSRFKRVFPGANDNYWNPVVSFKRKYKDFDNGDLRESYPGSKTVLVAFTDPYHWTNAVQNIGYMATFYISVNDIVKHNGSFKKHLLIDLATSLISNSIGFIIVHDGIFHK